MALDVGVVIIHGMGSQQPDFADGMIAKVKEKLGDKGDRVCFQPVYWAPVLSEREAIVWNNLSAECDLDWVRLRKFVINALGDATAYRYIPGEFDSTYYQIHDIVHRELTSLREGLGGDSKPLIVCAHSLGAVIMTDYIWDRQQGKDQGRYGQSPFVRMETLAGLVTFGCNIPLFTLAYDPVECITFPPATLSDDLKVKTKWLNLFDPDDILGWPLKKLSPAFGKAVTEDREINVGSVFTSWNPASHAEYWADGNFIKSVGEVVGGFL